MLSPICDIKVSIVGVTAALILDLKLMAASWQKRIEDDSIDRHIRCW